MWFRIAPLKRRRGGAGAGVRTGGGVNNNNKSSSTFGANNISGTTSPAAAPAAFSIFGSIRPNYNPLPLDPRTPPSHLLSSPSRPPPQPLTYIRPFASSPPLPEPLNFSTPLRLRHPGHTLPPQHSPPDYLLSTPPQTAGSRHQPATSRCPHSSMITRA